MKYITFPNSKNVQTLQEARLGPSEQLSPLAQLQIPNASQVINFGTDSNLNLPWILKGSNLVGKILTNVNSVGHTCMQDLGIPIQVSKTCFEIKERSLSLKFKPHNTYNTYLETKWSVPWFGCDEKLTCLSFNSNPGNCGGSTPIILFVWRIVFACLMVCRWQVQHGGQQWGLWQE
jgi:hypothetical protein